MELCEKKRHGGASVAIGYPTLQPPLPEPPLNMTILTCKMGFAKAKKHEVFFFFFNNLFILTKEKIKTNIGPKAQNLSIKPFFLFSQIKTLFSILYIYIYSTKQNKMPYLIVQKMKEKY